MLKKILFLFVICCTTNSFSQTTATDFTANDCGGISHHLFAELDSGKIVIIAWVMPCSLCAPGALSASDTADSYSVMYPGMVHFYIADDYGDTDCATLGAWVSANHMRCRTFSDSVIKMTDYGLSGMPKFVVLAGSDHKVFYQGGGSNPGPAIAHAIDSAMALTGISNLAASAGISAYPNPATDRVLINGITDTKNTKAVLYDLTGRRITTLVARTESNWTLVYDVSDIRSGTYVLRLQSREKNTAIKLFIVH